MVLRAAGERLRKPVRRFWQYTALIVGNLAYQLAEHLTRLRRGWCQPERRDDRQSRDSPKDRTCHW